MRSPMLLQNCYISVDELIFSRVAIQRSSYEVYFIHFNRFMSRYVVLQC